MADEYWEVIAMTVPAVTVATGRNIVEQPLSAILRCPRGDHLGVLGFTTPGRMLTCPICEKDYIWPEQGRPA